MFGGDDKPGAEGGLGFVFVIVVGLAGSVILSEIVWAAGFLTSLLSGHGVPGSTFGRGGEFAAATIASGNPAVSWTAKVTHGTPLGPNLLFWIILVIVVAAVGYLVVAVAKRVLTGRRRGRAKPANWARRKDTNPIEVPAEPEARPCRFTAGYVNDRLIAGGTGASFTVFGKQGTGKTAGLVIPNALEWDGPAIITTSKPADVAAMYAARARFGPVYIYSPAEPVPFPAACWSPVAYAADFEAATRMARWNVDAANMSDDGKGGRVWTKQASRYIAPLLLAANRSGGGIEAFVSFVSDGRSVRSEVETILRRSRLTDALDQYSSIWGVHEDGFRSIMLTAQAIIEPFENPRIRKSATHSDFTPADILDRKGTLFIVSPPTEGEMLAPAFTAATASIIHAAERKFSRINANRLDVRPGMEPLPISPRLACIFDEAGNVFRYAGLPRLLTTGRAMGIHMLTVWHDLSQLESLYGKENARTILSQSNARMLLPGCGDLETLKYFSELFGEALRTRTSTSRGNDGRNQTSIQQQWERLAHPHNLQQMDPWTAVMQYENLPPMQVELRKSFEDQKLLALAGATT